MHILFITKNFPTIVCGVGDYTYHLAKEFVDDAEVSIITSKVPVLEVNKFHIFPVVKAWNVFSIGTILRICQQQKPDYISIQYVPYSFSRKGMPFWLILLYWMLKLKGFTIITTFHEVGIRYTKHNIKRKITAAMQFFIARALSKFSLKNITSIDLYVNYLKKYTKSVYKIPVGTNILPYDLDATELIQLRNNITDTETFIVSTFGTRISDTILYAISELQKENKKIMLLILGNIPSASREYFTDKANELGIEKMIHITGYLSDKELFKYLKISSLYVMAEYVSEKGEGGISTKSGSLAAAFAAGLPILGTKGDTTDAIFRDNENILLINQYTVSAIIQKITEILHNPDRSKVLSEASLETYNTFFEWNVIHANYIKVMNDR